MSAPDRDSTAVSPEYVAALEQAVRTLALAVQTHRADMHEAGDRPCSTCSWSAKALRAVGVEPFVEGVGMDRVKAHDDATAAAVPVPKKCSSTARSVDR